MKIKKKTVMKTLLLACLIVAVFAASLIFSGSGPLGQNAEAAETGMRYHGDVDDDGEVTAADARLALRTAVGLEDYAPQSLPFARADYDRDGEITASDARMILRTAVALEPLIESDDRTPSEEAPGNSILVVYFSWSGHLDSMARWVADETGGDLYRVTAKDPYPTDYNQTADRAKSEQDNDVRPEIVIDITEEQMTQYDTVFFGFPVWWYDLPMSMWTFLESYDFSGKTIIPFFSHEGSSNGANALPTVEKLAAGATVRSDDALSIRGGKVDDSESDVRAWVQGLGYQKTAEAPQNEPAASGKALVVYYSASGNTGRVAGFVADELNADTFEIVPVQPYSDADLNWRDRSSRVNKEHDDASLQDIALVSTEVPNWDDYDVVLFGYPIWWREASWVVNNFIKNNDFTGKTVIPFCTSTSSGLGDSGTNLEKMAGTGTWLEGQRFNENPSEDSVREWVRGLVPG